MKHGKNYRNALAQVDREELLSATEAVEKVKALSTAKFDETVELAIRLGVDPRRAEQIVRGTLSLPAGTGKTNRVAAFAAREAAPTRSGPRTWWPRSPGDSSTSTWPSRPRT